MRIYFSLLFLLLSTVAVAEPEFGIGSGLESDEIADKSADLGAEWVRLTFDWFRIEPEQGFYDWRNTDEQVRRAERRNLKICAILYGTPSWANGGRPENVPPHDSAAWAAFIREVVRRYKRSDVIGAYSIWNEPNVSHFWKGNARDFIAKILIPGARAVKEADEKALVIAPDVSHHWIEDSKWKLAGLAHASEDIDVIGVHYYPDAPVNFEKYLDRWVDRERMAKPVWITEIGDVACSGKKGSEEKQRQWYLHFLQALSERSWITNVFPYRIWDPADQCNKHGNGFGLTYGPALIERPAYQAYRDFIRSRTAPEASPTP